MIRISICDGSREDSRVVEEMCCQYLDEIGVDYQFVNFLPGEALLEYCMNKANRRIDLLFLAVKLSGMDGIEVKRRVEKIDRVWRIVFVSGYKEYMQKAFGLKTLGFVTKPPQINAVSLQRLSVEPLLASAVIQIAPNQILYIFPHKTLLV